MQHYDLVILITRMGGVGERNVYVARKNGRGGYDRPKPLPWPINSKDRDDGSWVSADGRTMLVTYPGRGGEGGSVLFISFLRSGKWTHPANLGVSINSSYNEGRGVITPDGSSLVFTSDRPVNGGASGISQIWVAPLPTFVRLAQVNDRP